MVGGSNTAMTQSAYISMREFLRTGNFGNFQLGNSPEKLRIALGEPSNVSTLSRRNSTPGIWKYGDIEFHLSDDRMRIWLIFCDSFDKLEIGPAVSIDRWFFDGHTACEIVEQELASAQISFHRQNMQHEPTGYLLHLNSGIELLFSTGADPLAGPGRPGLFGFQYAKKEAS